MLTMLAISLSLFVPIYIYQSIYLPTELHSERE